MTSEYGIKEARPILGDLVTRVQQGAEITLTRNGRPVARIVPVVQEPADMTTTTEYGTWIQISDSTELTVASYIGTALGEHVDEYDTDAIEKDFRDAIAAVLPDGVTLAGETVYGPHATRADFDAAAVREAVEGIDFWAIAARHDHGTLAEMSQHQDA